MSACPKCGGAMAEGFVIDEGGYGAIAVSRWQEGEPRRSIWTGIKSSEEDQIRVTTFRCERCGFLESYARG